MISYQGLSRLHVAQEKMSVDAEYYVENILKEVCLPAINKTATAGSVLERRMVDCRSTNSFIQGDAPAHRPARAQKWYQEYFPSFWTNDT